MGGMETRLGEKIDILEDSVKNNKKKIEILTSTVRKNTEELSGLEERVAQGELALEDQVADIVRNQLASAGHGKADSSVLSSSTASSVASRHHLTQAQIAKYWQFRKSLRLWPISG